MNIPIDSPLAYIGFLLVAIGGFMVLAGLDVITIQQVSVKQGTKTWVIGLVLAVMGLALLVPELIPSKGSPSDENLVSNEEPAESASAEPAAPDSSVASADLGADWQPVGIELPAGPLWTRTGDQAYRATGLADTIAWSEESYEGDLEIQVDISSTSRLGEANIIVYGDGKGFSPGCLIFNVGNDYQKIVSGTVYDTGTFFGESSLMVDFGEQAPSHTMGARIADGVATLSLDGAVIISADLGDDVNTAGKIGLYKYAGRPDVTFSNVQIRITSGD